jgi:septal ring factor EnvC (AmiA/AmiB activator)
MADEPINLVLEHLRAIRADMQEVKHAQQDQGQRLIRMELALAGLRRDQASDAENVVFVSARVDKLSEEIDRIKRRLELID